MDEKWKKILYTGIGMAANASEKVKDKVEELMESKNFNKEEGKKMIDDFMDTASEKKVEVEERLKEFVDNVKEKFDTDKIENVDKLKMKIKNLKINHKNQLLYLYLNLLQFQTHYLIE